MRLSKMRIAAVLVGLGVPSLAFAPWSGAGLVNNVYSHEGYHFIDSTIPDAPCGLAGRFWWPITDPDAKYMFALATTALVAAKNITVVYDSASPNCIFGGQLATHLQMAR